MLSRFKVTVTHCHECNFLKNAVRQQKKVKIQGRCNHLYHHSTTYFSGKSTCKLFSESTMSMLTPHTTPAPHFKPLITFLSALFSFFVTQNVCLPTQQLRNSTFLSSSIFLTPLLKAAFLWLIRHFSSVWILCGYFVRSELLCGDHRIFTLYCSDTLLLGSCMPFEESFTEPVCALGKARALCLDHTSTFLAQDVHALCLALRSRAMLGFVNQSYPKLTCLLSDK